MATVTDADRWLREMRREIVSFLFLCFFPLAGLLCSFSLLALAQTRRPQIKILILLKEARRRAPADEPKITIEDLRFGSYGEWV